MSAESAVLETVREQEAPAVVPTRVPLEQVVEAVRRDSRAEPVKFLNEVVVPYGGE
jgi:hypothetical protein